MNGWKRIMIFYRTCLSFPLHRPLEITRQATVCNRTPKDFAQTTI